MLLVFLCLLLLGSRFLSQLSQLICSHFPLGIFASASKKSQRIHEQWKIICWADTHNDKTMKWEEGTPLMVNMLHIKGYARRSKYILPFDTDHSAFGRSIGQSIFPVFLAATHFKFTEISSHQDVLLWCCLLLNHFRGSFILQNTASPRNGQGQLVM